MKLPPYKVVRTDATSIVIVPEHASSWDDANTKFIALKKALDESGVAYETGSQWMFGVRILDGLKPIRELSEECGK